MKNISFVFVAALSFAAFGCKKKSGGGAGDCVKAIDNSMAVSKADMEKMGVDAKLMAKMKDVGIQHCKDDKWPDAAIKCMTDAKTEADAQACYGKLSSEQQDKMNKAAMELATPTGDGAGSAGSAADVGSAGSAMGSDMGSAGSAGSAAAGSAAAGSAAPTK